MNAEYEERFGISQTALLGRFLDVIDCDARILEVGCNVGVQLECLRELGFENCYGLDLQRGALETVGRVRPDVRRIQGAGQRLPFADDAFDLVLTVGALIHVPPTELDAVLDEITRCSSEWIVGSEYYATSHTEVRYRGETGARSPTGTTDATGTTNATTSANGTATDSGGERRRRTDASDLTDADGPEMGVPAALAALGGGAYVLDRRLGEREGDDSSD